MQEAVELAHVTVQHGIAARVQHRRNVRFPEEHLVVRAPFHHMHETERGVRVGHVAPAHEAHAQPALEALDRWLVGNALAPEVEALIGLGAGVTAPGDDYLGGMLLGLRLAGRGAQAASLWRWLEPRLAGRTREISAAHLAAAAAGETQEPLHTVLNGEDAFERLDAAGWNGLAGALAVAKRYDWR